MEILEYGKIIRKRLWIIVLLMAISGPASAYYAMQQEPTYRTTTTLVINPAAPAAVLPYQTARGVQSLANTYAEYMRTRSFADLVAAELDFDLSPGAITRALSTSYVSDTQIFRISATHTNPHVAQALANTAAAVLIAENTARQRAEQELLRAQRDPRRADERERLAELQSVLQDEIAYYNDQIQRIERQIANLEGGPRTDVVDQQILNLRGDLVSYRTSRVSVLGSLAQTQSALAASADDGMPSIDTAVVIDAAPLPSQASSQNISIAVLFGLLGAVGLGVAISFLLEYVDYTVKTPEELDNVYGLATQGAIGVASPANGHTKNAPAPITLTHPRSPISEAFRALRTSIRMASLTAPIHSLLVTSAGPGEGKTFIATNLAISLAQEGNKVILVDADLRRPQLHRIFELRREPGFTNLVLHGHNTAQQLLQPTTVENLDVLACGTIPPNPAELLSSARALEVMEELCGLADIVVYDSPPAATVTDAVIMARRMDAVSQVVLAGRTRIDLVRRCKALLERTEARVLGPVLNRVKMSDLGYYAYYYHYGYYQNGHEAEEKSGMRRLLGSRKGSRKGSRGGSRKNSRNHAHTDQQQEEEDNLR